MRCNICGRLCDAQDNQGESIEIFLEETVGCVCSQECLKISHDQGDF